MITLKNTNQIALQIVFYIDKSYCAILKLQYQKCSFGKP